MGLYWPHAALAHPHIYADYNVQVTGDSAGIRALHFRFKFDDMYSAIMTSEMHVQGMPELDTKDTRTVKAAPETFLQGQHFFLYLTADGKTLPPQEIHVTAAHLGDADTDYLFDFPLPVPAKNIVFSLYDPTYYISVSQMDGEPVKTSPPIACTTATKTTSFTIWGLLRAAEVTCVIAP